MSFSTAANIISSDFIEQILTEAIWSLEIGPASPTHLY